MSAPAPVAAVVDLTTEATREASRRVIARHAALAAAAVLIPIPLADSLSVTAVQLEMFRALARLHHQPENARELSAVLASIGGGVLSVFIGRSGPAVAFKAAALAIPV